MSWSLSHDEMEEGNGVKGKALCASMSDEEHRAVFLTATSSYEFPLRYLGSCTLNRPNSY